MMIRKWISPTTAAVALASAIATTQATAYEPAPLQDVPVEAAASASTEAPDENSAAPIDQPIVETQDHASASLPCTCCESKSCKEAATAKMKSAYKGVFYANDFTYLSDRCYDGPSFPGDSLKGLHCGKLDIGGEARVRFHSENNIRNGYSGDDDNFWLTRLRLFANYRANEYIRLYGEYLYADSGGETFENRTIEENRGEIQNLFFDTRLTSDLTLRLGRQELLLGSQRLVSPLDWANTRRTFDGGRFLYKGDVWNVDGFFTHPVNRTRENESKIDDTDETVDFYGLYASRKVAKGTVDAYYLGLDDSVGDFNFHTLGYRFAGKIGCGWLYETESGVQFGENSNGSDHSAYFSTTGLGRQLNLCTHCGPWKPTIWFWYDYASGEDDFANVGRGDDGFDHLFPLAHKYLGFMDFYGRRNLHDLNAQFITPLMGNPNVKLLLWYHYFMLDERTTPYSVTLQPINTVAPAGDRELGHEIDVLFNIAVNPRNSVLLGYSFFAAGDYYDTTPGVATNQDAQFFYMQYQTRF